MKEGRKEGRKEGNSFLHLPRKMEPIEGSETLAFKPQTPGKYPKENILHRAPLSVSFFQLTTSPFILPHMLGEMIYY